MSIGHMWVPTAVARRNLWRLWYQLPLAAPLAGEAVIRNGRFVRQMFAAGRRDGRDWTEEELETYLAPLREPQGARAGTLLYRHFLTRELPAAAARRVPRPPPRDARADAVRPPRRARRRLRPRLRAPRRRRRVRARRRRRHFLPEEAPGLVAERIRAM